MGFRECCGISLETSEIKLLYQRMECERLTMISSEGGASA